MNGDSGPDRELDALAQAFVARLRAGELPDPEEYAAEHPALAERIRGLFPVLAVVEGVKPPQPRPSATAGGRPERIERYRIEREIGRGGMGRVFEARREGEKRVALKLVHPHLADRPGFHARFLREIEAGRRLEHPGVVRTLDAGVADLDGIETPYLVLEYVEGQNLDELLREVGTVSERLAREIGLRIAEALDAVHAAGMVHRDVKPENVVISPDESVKLMDLGVALIQEEALRLTQTGEFVGSLLYAAPEQLDGGEVDDRTDLYALGLLLLELVSGEDRQGAEGALRGRLRRSGVRSAIQALSARTSPFFEGVVRRLLARDPARRFQRASSVVDVLREGEQSAWWQQQSPGRPRVHASGAETPLMGREAELRRLDALLEDARSGAGRVLLLEAEAGMGKSRLILEWLDRVEADRQGGPRSILARYEPGADAHAVPPMAVALRSGLQGDDLVARIRSLLPVGSELAVALARHLRGEEEPTDAPALVGNVRSTAYARLLRGLAAERPLVVVLEDLHFASEEGREVFLQLSRALARDPVLILGTARPGVEGLWPVDLDRADHAHRLALPPLGLEAAHALVKAVAGLDVHPRQDVGELVRSADGNPFCLLEFAHQVHRRQRARGGTTEAGVPIPPSLRLLVETRLAELPAELRDLLSVAACCGDPFDPVLACEACEVPRIRGLRGFHDIDREYGLIRAEGAAYRFRHHLVREVLHDELPAALRAAYHTALGTVLEARAQPEGLAGITDAEAFALARHFLLGDEPERAIPYAPDGLAHLHHVHEFHRGVRMANRVLALGDRLPPEVRGRVLVGRGLSLLSFAPPQEAVETLEEAHELCRELDEPLLRSRVATALAICYRHTGRAALALPLIEEAVAQADRHGSTAEETRARGWMAQTFSEIGRTEDAQREGERAFALAQETGDATLVGEIARHLGAVQLDLGNLPRAKELLEHALSVGHLYGESVIEMNALILLGKIGYLEGDIHGSLEATKRLLALHEQEGTTRLQCIAHVNLATLAAKIGDYDGEEEHGRRAADIARRMDYRDALAHALVSLGGCHEARGRLARAEADFRRAREIALDLGQPLFVARMSHPVARIRALLGRTEEALQLVQEGAEAMREMGARREAAHMSGAEADVLECRGDDEAAVPLWERGLKELTAAGMKHEAAVTGLRLGAGLVRLGQRDAARVHLRESLTFFERARLRGFEALARAWASVAGEGDPLRARLLLRDALDTIPVPWGVRALEALGHELADPELLNQARDGVEAMIHQAPEAVRAAMRRLPIHRQILDRREPPRP